MLVLFLLSVQLYRFLIRKLQIYHDSLARTNRKSERIQNTVTLSIKCAIASVAGILWDVQTNSSMCSLRENFFLISAV